MPEEERQVCERIRRYRTEVLHLSQTAVAMRLQIDSTRITAAELARVPVKFSFGDRFARAYNVNQKWLAEGKGNPTPYVRFSLDFTQQLPQSDTYLAVWKTHLRETYLDAEKGELLELLEYLGEAPVVLPSDYQASDLLVGLTSRITAKLNSLPPVLKWKLLRALHETITVYEVHPSSEVRPADFAQNASHLSLTAVTVKRNTGSMTEMQQLLARLRPFLGIPGGRAELAKELDVPMPRISEWTRKIKTVIPSGETALKILRWVEQQERKQKTPDSATNTAGINQTQQRKADREVKPSSSGRKKP